MTLKMIGAAIGTGVGLVVAVVVLVFLWRIKGELNDARDRKDNADVVRLTGEIAELKTSLAQKDSIAAQTAATFLTARSTFQSRPIVTGGGAKADAIANNAVQACFETASKALSACQVARVTADSVPILKDSLSTIEKRLLSRSRRWTAHGGAFYSWPERAPLLRVETQFRIMNSLSAVAGAEAVVKGATRADSSTWRDNARVYTGVTIPFR